MDTVEVLQAGTPGEREQRLVSMTAALMAARAQGMAQEQRAGELLVSQHASIQLLAICMHTYM